MNTDIFSLKSEALKLRFQDEYTLNKFIKNLKKDGNSPEIIYQIIEIYNRFAGDPNFPMILSELKFPDNTINLKDTITFCTAQRDDIIFLIDEILESQNHIVHSFEVRQQLFCEEILDILKRDKAKKIITFFNKTDDAIDFLDEIENSIFLDQLDFESGKFALETYQKLFPPTFPSITRYSQKIFNNEKIKKRIRNTVKQYLFPYISNFKVSELNHIPLFSVLKEKFIMPENKLIRLALKAYIYVGAAGLDTNYHVNGSLDSLSKTSSLFHLNLTNIYPEYTSPEYTSIKSKVENFFGNDLQKAEPTQLEWYNEYNPNNKFKPFSRGFLILLKTLSSSIKKDFPTFKMNPEKLTWLAIQALETVNKKRRFEAMENLNLDSI